MPLQSSAHRDSMSMMRDNPMLSLLGPPLDHYKQFEYLATFGLCQEKLVLCR